MRTTFIFHILTLSFAAHSFRMGPEPIGEEHSEGPSITLAPRSVPIPSALPSLSISTIPPAGQPLAASPPSNPSTNATIQHPQIANPSQYHHFDCGTDASAASDHLISTLHNLHSASLNGSSSILPTPHTGGPAAHAAPTARAITRIGPVPVYIHVVTTHASAGIVKPPQIPQQVAALNTAYNPHSVSFTLKGSDFTTNDAWAVGATPADDLAMKKALRKGSYATLNLYLQSDMAGGTLGKCTLPTNVGNTPQSSTYTVDGCNIAAGTAPGGPIAGYNMGKTAVHETGHWLGLLHTFEGNSCSGTGDFVADTPAESQSTDGCPTDPWKNSCAGSRAGVDPIHNYMDYSTDACYTRFTPGQEGRMRDLWGTYRAGK